MSFYDEDRVTWRHVSFSSMLDRRQAILLLDYMRSMILDDCPVRERQAILLSNVQQKLADYWERHES